MERPLANAKVKASHTLMIGSAGRVYPQQQTTNDEGRFAFDSLPGRKITLSAEAPGCADTRQEIHLKPGEVKSDVRLAAGKSLSISGRVTNMNGEPLEGVSIIANGQGAGANSYRSATTDSDGKYVLDGMNPQPVYLSVHREGFASILVSNIIAPKEGQDFQLAPAVEVLFAGYVVDRSTRNPIADFTVSHENDRGTIEKDPARPGRFTVKGLKSGSQNRFTIEAQGYPKQTSEPIKISGGKAVFEKTFELTRGRAHRRARPGRSGKAAQSKR